MPDVLHHPARDENTGLFQYDPGCVTLDGDQALAYARSRHFEIQRTAERPSGRRTRPATSAASPASSSSSRPRCARPCAKGVRNPFVLKDLVGVAQKNVTLDTEFSIQDLVDLGLQFQDFDPDQLVTYTPVGRRARWAGP